MLIQNKWRERERTYDLDFPFLDHLKHTWFRWETDDSSKPNFIFCQQTSPIITGKDCFRKLSYVSSGNDDFFLSQVRSNESCRWLFDMVFSNSEDAGASICATQFESITMRSRRRMWRVRGCKHVSNQFWSCLFDIVYLPASCLIHA